MEVIRTANQTTFEVERDGIVVIVQPTISTSTSNSGGSDVDSVNGQTGIVVLDKTDIGLDEVDNTSDADKPISDDTQDALNDKVNTDDLGSAAFTESSDYATAAQGLKALSGNMSVYLSPSNTDLETGDTDTIEAPYNFTLVSAFIALTEAPTGGSVIVDFKKNGVSITSTKATIYSNEFNSLTGVSPVFTDVNFVKGDQITHNIFQVGSLTTGKSLKSYLSVTKI